MYRLARTSRRALLSLPARLWQREQPASQLASLSVRPVRTAAFAASHRHHSATLGRHRQRPASSRQAPLASRLQAALQLARFSAQLRPSALRQHRPAHPPCAAAKISATVSFLSAIDSPLCRDCVCIPGNNLGGRSASTRSRSRNREFGLATGPAGLRQSITLQQVIGTTGPARQGIVTFFTIFSLLFMPQSIACQPPLLDSSRSPTRRRPPFCGAQTHMVKIKLLRAVRVRNTYNIA